MGLFMVNYGCTRYIEHIRTHLFNYLFANKGNLYMSLQETILKQFFFDEFHFEVNRIHGSLRIIIANLRRLLDINFKK